MRAEETARSRIEENRSRPTFTTAFQPACIAAAPRTAANTTGSTASLPQSAGGPGAGICRARDAARPAMPVVAGTPPSRVIVGIKIVVLYVLATFFRMHVADRLLMAILLSQAGEFAFVVFEFAHSARIMTEHENQVWSVVVALSMALTPFLLLVFDKVMVPRINARETLPPVPHDRLRA